MSKGGVPSCLCRRFGSTNDHLTAIMRWHATRIVDNLNHLVHQFLVMSIFLDACIKRFHARERISMHLDNEQLISSLGFICLGFGHTYS